MKKLFTLVLIVFTVVAGFAQDIHYSQFFNAPLLLNPGLTGFTSGTYRIGANYRNQWFSAAGGGFGSSPYMTTSVGFDMPIKVKQDAAGVGLFIASDQAGANTFSTIMVVASGSYIKTLGKKQNHRLSLGVQVGYTNTSLKTQNFQFANQFQDNVFTSTISSNENIGKKNAGYVNLNTGLIWYGKFSKKFGMYAGGSLFNLSQPKYDLLSDQSHRLYMRYNLQTGLDFTLGSKFHLLPSLLYMAQEPDNQINCGLGFGIDFTKDMSLTLGIYNRLNTLSAKAHDDGIIPYAAFEVKGFKLGLSYDATVSTLKSNGSGVGAFELSLSYTGRKKNYNFRDALIYPRF